MKLAKAYEPNQYEPTIYALWENSGAFLPAKEGEPYSIVMPPPNANGNLHLGHALTVGLQDILVRYNRMRGRDTVYIPGADHAGFETWVVYEKQLEKQGKSRFDFSREQLYSQVWNFVEQQRGGMELQLRALGASASWQHLTFTLDEKVINTVYGTFKKLWDDKLIYRGERIVNYCTKHQTSFSDIEVEHKNEKGKLWQIAYPLLDKIGEITVATTRPETMLGDVAIAVHPNDERYKNLVGTRVLLPIVQREIPIIADEGVDPKFGTGAVKITPAHDPLDFEIGQRHKLKPIQVIGFDGKITEAAPAQFVGLDIMKTRERVLAALKAAELLRGETAHEHSVGHCYKCDTVIQPLLKDQWFLRVRPLAEKAKQVIEQDKIKFTPKNGQRLVVQYLDNLKDWNLSRQIPWGIPIPAFQNENNPDDWIFDPRVGEEYIEVKGQRYRRENDTFDTWFSSGQWPFVVTDYLNRGELSQFYPTNMMETGQDLLDRWVARMIMLGLYATGEVPFKEVYMHGMVLDERGQKMSKSKGNVINPQDIVDNYGSDALRLGIVASRSAGQNQAFSKSKVVAGRNFCNKLWNIARYMEDRIGVKPVLNAEPQTIADHWIISQLNQTSSEVAKLLENNRFAEAADLVYHTIWDSVADWYLEAAKKQRSTDMLAWVLTTSLKLAHPFAPFVTETIWQTLAWENTPLISAAWPEAAVYNEIAAGEFEQVQKLVIEARYVSAALGSNKQTLIYSQDSLIADQADMICHLAKLKAVSQTDQPHGLRLAVANREAWFDVSAHTVKRHRKNLEERLKVVQQQVSKLESRLQNEGYVKNAPAKVVEETKQQLTENQVIAERLQGELKVIG